MLTEKQKLAAALMFQWGLSTTKVAEQIGVHRATVWRWTKKKEFDREMRRLCREMHRALNAERNEYRKKALARWRAKLWRRKQILDKAAKTGNKTAIRNAYNAWERVLLSRPLI